MARVLIASGGTGGHLFPSVVLADQLKKEGIEVLIAGAKLSANPYFDKAQYPFCDVSSKPGLKGLPYIGKGTLESFGILKRYKPDLIVGFGSFTSFPILMAAALKRVPMILWAADAKPGKVIRWFSPYAKLTALNYPEAKAHLKGNTAVSLMPLREGFKKGAFSKKESLSYFGFSGEHPILLVVGGSQGAYFLNRIVPMAARGLPKPLDILHLAGSDAQSEKVKEEYKKADMKAVVKSFEPSMHHAWRVADIACARAGAVSCSEQLEFEVPGVLIPYPSAADNHQMENGLILKACGLVEVLNEKEANPEKLAKLLTSVLFSSSLRMEKGRIHKEKQTSKSLTEWVKDYL